MITKNKRSHIQGGDFWTTPAGHHYSSAIQAHLSDAYYSLGNETMYEFNKMDEEQLNAVVETAFKSLQKCEEGDFPIHKVMKVATYWMK